MNNNLNFIKNIDLEKLKLFKNKTKHNIEIKTTNQKAYLDYSTIENSIIYLDNIIRNPKKFIIPEEDILRIEKTKKVSQESIRHLASHTSFIQEVDEDGFIKPKKLLNLNKEETFDLYENRFIYTLLKKLIFFLETKLKELKIETDYKMEKNIRYKATTKINDEIINVDLNLNKQLIKLENQKFLEDIKNRIEKLMQTIEGFMKSSFIKSISMASLVHSPIKKTNLILKDLNFRKALEIWECIEKYDTIKSSDIKQDVQIEKDNNLKEKFLVTYYLNYDSIDNEEQEILSEENKWLEIKNLIKDLALNSNMSINKFKNNLESTFNQIKNEDKKNNEQIKKIILKYENKWLENLNNIVSSLSKE